MFCSEDILSSSIKKKLSFTIPGSCVCLGWPHKLKCTRLHYILSLIMCTRFKEQTVQSPPAAANASPALNSAEYLHHSGSIYSCPDGGFSPTGHVPSKTKLEVSVLKDLSVPTEYEATVWWLSEHIFSSIFSLTPVQRNTRVD